MLVYCNNLILNPPDGIDAVARCIATWVGKKSKGYVNPKALLGGAQLRLKDGSRLSSVSTFGQGSPLSFPVLALANPSRPRCAWSSVGNGNWRSPSYSRRSNRMLCF